MHHKKSLDQIFLLVVAFTVIAGLYSLITFIDQRGISESTGFFITANVFLSFILTWNAKVSFGRTPRFWEYHVMWMFVHAAIAVVWGYSGFWIELCVVFLPLEAYVYYKAMNYRLSRLAADASVLSSDVIGNTTASDGAAKQ
jgi:hypothetical protein